MLISPTARTTRVTGATLCSSPCLTCRAPSTVLSLIAISLLRFLKMHNAVVALERQGRSVPLRNQNAYWLHEMYLPWGLEILKLKSCVCAHLIDHRMPQEHENLRMAVYEALKSPALVSATRKPTQTSENGWAGNQQVRITGVSADTCAMMTRRDCSYRRTYSAFHRLLQVIALRWTTTRFNLHSEWRRRAHRLLHDLKARGADTYAEAQ
jgi:hypothetical protein